MMQDLKLKVVEVSGSHLEMGRQIGEATSPQVKHSIENGRKLLQDAYENLQLSWKGARIQASKYIPFAEERYPQYVEEMRGIAEGAGVRFEDIAVLNVLEGVTVDALHLSKCTSMAVNQERTVDNQVLIAHNEDWMPEDESDVFLIHARPNDEPAFLAMTYGGLLPNVGMNEAGIAQTCDSVYTSDRRIGIPRIIVSRAVLAARTPNEAIRRTLIPHRAAGYNHLIVHESGEIYSVEVSARHFALLYGSQGFMVHTNHYLDSEMQHVEKNSDELISTRVRYWRAFRLLRQVNQHTVQTLQAIQRDHVNFPDSICRHDNLGSPLDREKTIVSMVMDLTKREIHAVWGSPCENKPYVYRLESSTLLLESTTPQVPPEAAGSLA